MTQLGGPGALNGFLYQILQHIGMLAEARIFNAIDSQVLGAEWTLVLEPRSGGDAQVLAGEYVVEQYKVRTGTWSITAIVEDVLKGLRRAVPSPFPTNASYRFVTDGRPGRDVAELLAFFERVRLAGRADRLDDAEQRNYDGQPYTDRALFDLITVATRSSSSGASAGELDQVLHLLANFHIVWGDSMNALEAKVDRLLWHYFPDLHDARTARRSLVGLLNEKLSKGELRLGPQQIIELFLEVNLDPEILEKLADLAEKLAQMTNERLRKSGYIPANDVRRAVNWPADRPVLLITGGSGNGKSWQLARLVHELAEQREIVTWSMALDGSTAQLNQITDDVWASGLHQQGSRSLAALNLYYQELVPKEGHWLTAAVDDVSDPELARQLVQRDWSADGTRLVMAASQPVAEYVKSLFPTVVHVHEMSEFSIAELDTYLKRNGRRWSDLPDDLKQLLKKPILAGLYIRLPYQSFESAPRSEYEIFDGFWRRMRERAAAGDQGLLLALAARPLEKGSYPVARAEWSQIGADAEAAGRLEALGWLRVGDDGELAFAHDRLLNWAVARELARRVASNSIAAPELANILATCITDPKAYPRPLGYVLMDVLWMLAEQTVEAFTDAVLEHLEEDSHLARDLYEGLLQTLGKYAVGMLLRRLKSVSLANDYRTVYIGNALERVARQEGAPVAGAIDELLASKSSQEQRIGLRLLAVQPDPRYLDRLWSLHHWHSEDRPAEFRDSTWFNAARACLALRPDWIVERAFSSDTPDASVADLTYILVGLEHPNALSIWNSVRASFVERVPMAHSRGVLYCIARFCDTDYIQYCIDRLKVQDDFVGSAALTALARIAPTIALERLGDVAESARYPSVSNWLPQLMEWQPHAIQERLLDLAEDDRSVVKSVGMLFQQSPDEVGPALLSAFLRAFEKELVEQSVAANGVQNDDWLSRPLDLLSRLSNAEALSILRQERGGDLEHLVTAAACRRIGHSSGSLDRILESARQTLLRIAGSGILDLIGAELASKEYWGRHGGLLWAETAGVTAKAPLHSIALQWTEDADSQSRMETHLALSKLAALGADAELIDAIWRVGTDCVSNTLAHLRSDHGPVDRAFLQQALLVVREPSIDDATLNRALTIAWLSGDKAFVPLIRPRLSQLDPSSTTAVLVALALLRLEDRSDELLSLAQRLLATSEKRWMGMNVLASFGDRGYDILLADLESRQPLTWSYEDEALIEALYEHGPTRAAAIRAALRSLSRSRWSLHSPPFEIAAEMDSPAVQDKVLEAAFTTDRTVVGRAVEATKAIGKFDPARALEAATLELMAGAKTADSICRVVADVAGSEAIQWLTSMARKAPADRLGAIGRALRRFEPNVEAELEALLQSSLRAERTIGAELAGWTNVPGDARLREIYGTDSEGPVRDAVAVSLRRRRQLANSLRLIEEIVRQPEATQWSLLLALILSTHSSLLTDRSSEFWLGRVLDRLPPRFEQFAREHLKNKDETT